MQNPKIEIVVKNYGTMTAELYPEMAPKTVENFLKLAEEDFFAGLIFHRVISGFMIQGGGYTADFTRKDASPIEGEFIGNGFAGNTLKHTRGVLSMARTMIPDSAGSQFFIMHEDAPHLDDQYAAFGKVIEGIENVDKIAEVQTDFRDKPKQAQVMKKVTVETFGVEYPEPIKA